MPIGSPKGVAIVKDAITNLLNKKKTTNIPDYSMCTLEVKNLQK
jgi:rRNA processing protein Krr1/Pno1